MDIKEVLTQELRDDIKECRTSEVELARRDEPA